jgi:hypothetical protein
MAVIAIAIAPGLTSTLRSAVAVETFREPFTSLAFADPDRAARGFVANEPVVVVVTNETGATASLVLIASGEDNWRAEQPLELAAGAEANISFLPPPGIGSISVAIEGRDVLIRAAVLP